MGKKKPKATERTTIADQLRQAIEDSGESVYAIAKAAGIAQPVLHRFAAGERDLTLTTADKLLEYFGLELTPTRKTKAR
ncbi:MAG: helix-turn-helix transcriptional regulator [Planctomycetota bacterium]|nr:helix-turn-helix transcriptional regulator [Planctomycetota bacterium]